MGSKAPGRPYYVADIPFKVDKELSLVNEFYSVAKRLNYRRRIEHHPPDTIKSPDHYSSWSRHNCCNNSDFGSGI